MPVRKVDPERRAAICISGGEVRAVYLIAADTDLTEVVRVLQSETGLPGGWLTAPVDGELSQRGEPDGGAGSTHALAWRLMMLHVPARLAIAVIVAMFVLGYGIGLSFL